MRMRWGLIYETQGSGVILTMDQNRIYVSTAAHCLKHVHTEVEFADGTRCDGVVVYKNPAKDVGFIAVDAGALSEETLSGDFPGSRDECAGSGKKPGGSAVCGEFIRRSQRSRAGRNFGSIQRSISQ